MKYTAVVLAAGQGKRMQSSIQKQYLLLQEKPVLHYALKAFEEVEEISEIILVVGEDEKAYVQEAVVDAYQLQKVKKIVAGGKERYHSVYNALREIKGCDYVFIHDGARPLIDKATIERAAEAVTEHEAVIVGMPVKDTIKIVDESNVVIETPRRETVWAVQTPQVFSYSLIWGVYQELIPKEQELLREGIRITDDAMVVEHFTDIPVKLIEGSYENIKITTPEDLAVAESFLHNASLKKQVPVQR